jgi:hypothetical protein
MHVEPLHAAILRCCPVGFHWPLPVKRRGWEGDVVLVEFLEGAPDAHKPEEDRWLIDTPEGQRVEPIPGLQVRGALGSRFSPRYGISAKIPPHGISPGEIVHLISVSGLFSRLDSPVAGDRDLKGEPVICPPRARVLGFFPGPQPEENLNLRDWAYSFSSMSNLKPSCSSNLWMVVGSSTATGKTQAMQDLARFFKDQGTPCVGIKVAGIAGIRDLQAVKRAGAIAVYDFLDLGVGRSELDDAAGFRQRTLHLIGWMEAAYPGLPILCEVGGSVNLFQHLLDIQEIRSRITGIVFCASDPVALLGMFCLLEPLGPVRTKIIAAAGPCVNNVPLRQKVFQLSGLISLKEWLAHHSLGSGGTQPSPLHLNRNMI